MRLTSAILTAALLVIAASTAADGRGILIEGAGRQQDVSIGRKTQIGRSESGILLLGEFSTQELSSDMPVETAFPSNLRFPRKCIEPPKRTSSRRGFRYGEGLAYSPGTRNIGHYRSNAFQYGSGIGYGNRFSYGSGLRYSGPVRYRDRQAYKPNINYGSGMRYGEDLRREMGRQR